METKKKNVSLRMSPNDIDRIRHIADRLGVKESDVLRFSVKQMLTRLAPFQEDSYHGVDLMPALLEVGQDMVRFFELGVDQLNAIVNQGVTESERCIDPEDLKLLALSSANGKYARLKLSGESHQDVTDDEGFKDYFLEKYFRTEGYKPESANSDQVDSSVKTEREWMPFVASASKESFTTSKGSLASSEMTRRIVLSKKSA